MNPRLIGVTSLLLAALSYGLYGTYAKFLGPSFGSFSQSSVRNIFVAVLITIFLMLTRRKLIKVNKTDWKWIFIWSIGALSTVFIYFSFNHLAIGTAYFLLYAGMIGTGLVGGKLFFDERINAQKLVAITLSLLGLIIIYFYDIKSANILFVISALVAGIMAGLWNTLSKKVSSIYPVYQLVLIDTLISTIVGFTGALLLSEKLPSLVSVNPWVITAIWAITQVAASSLTIYGFKKLEAQIASVIIPMEVIFGTIFGYLFFGQVLPTTTLIGGLMIASAAAVASLESK